jgi:hypothetical protein
MWRPADPFTGFPETSAFIKLERSQVPNVCGLHSHCYCSQKSHHDDGDDDDNNTFRHYLINVTGKHEIKELQKTAILGTAHKLREVLM